MADNVVGLDAMLQSLNLLPQQIVAAAGTALREEGERIMTDAKRRCPVATGALRASGHVTGPDADAVVRMTFGGPAVSYAVYVHENLSARHAPPYGTGGEAKFLERAALEAEHDMGARISARIRSLLS